MTAWRNGIGLVFLLLANAGAFADTLQPGYLEFIQQDARLWRLVWKAPVQSGATRPASPTLPASCAPIGNNDSWLATQINTQQWQVRCAEILDGQTLGIHKLPIGFTEVIARIQFLGGTVQTHRLTDEAPSILLSNTHRHDSVLRAYLFLGYEHILEGYDHILFVLCLVLLVLRPWDVVKTVTTFTVAHSITLALLTQGWVVVNRTLVEVLIALSIVVLAAEVVNQEKNRSAAAPKRARPPARQPALRPALAAAFMFGLLHGLGFAGALAEIGVPQGESLIALLGFNVGVELGQLCIVAVIMTLLWLTEKCFSLALAKRLSLLASGVSGIIGAYWVFERLLT